MREGMTTLREDAWHKVKAGSPPMKRPCGSPARLAELFRKNVHIVQSCPFAHVALFRHMSSGGQTIWRMEKKVVSKQKGLSRLPIESTLEAGMVLTGPGGEIPAGRQGQSA